MSQDGTSQGTRRAPTMDEAEDIGSNHTANTTLEEIAAERLTRRTIVGGLFATAAATSLPAGPAPAQGARPTAVARSRFGFTELVAGSDDTAHVAPGHEAQVLIRWGDKVTADAPAFDPRAQTAEAQARQFGYNNDFLGYIPLRGSRRGVLVVNHEYTNRELMLPGMAAEDGRVTRRVTPEIAGIEMMGHGGSVIEIARIGGRWRVVQDSRLNRRITAMTPMRIAGPAAGHPLLRTAADPDARNVLGMLNNCAGGITPWGTWLTCEENINGYFIGRVEGHEHEKSFRRYGIPSGWYNWGAWHDRFDITKEPNEPNRFGWVVEIDPLDPGSTPVKRTALGRFKHEGAGGVVNRDGRYVVYSGDDERFDYVYRFVTSGRVNRRKRSANRDLLDSGTLSVARFEADGTGRWLPLVHGQGPLTAAGGFRDQGEVLINARLAADALGATKMDRPEDIEVSPRTGRVYVMLTANDRRTAAQVDAANPRAANRFGHIVEITPEDGDHAAERFRWDILVRCGDPSAPGVGAVFNPATTANGWFANPDNALIDADGRLWIATDGNSARTTGRNDGVWGVETEGAARGTSKLLFRVPHGAELCGPMTTPDMTTMFVAVQHPGQGEGPNGPSSYASPSTRWPDFSPDMPPRPSVVAITRRGGGKVGT